MSRHNREKRQKGRPDGRPVDYTVTIKNDIIPSAEFVARGVKTE